MDEPHDPDAIRNRGIRILVAGIICLIGTVGLYIAFTVLDADLARTHQRINPNNDVLKVIGAAGLLLVVLGPILTLAGAIQLITKKNVWHALTKPM